MQQPSALKQYRLYPTQLRAVKNISELNKQDECQKGYFDPNTTNSLQIGVSPKQKIYIFSPGNWYSLYSCTIKGQQTSNNNNNNLSEDDRMDQLIKAKTSDDTDELWKLIASVVGVEMGRSAFYKDGDRFITITNINSSMAKNCYYLFKHAFKKRQWVIEQKKHFITNPLHKAALPDVREKPKRE